MPSSLDPLILILIVAAGFVLWRLYGVLGQRTGHEGPRFDPFNPASAARTKGQDAATGEDAAPVPSVESAKPVWHGVADEGSQLATELEAVAKADNSFSVSGFLEGAKMAYEMTVEAFAKGEKTALKPLLNREVYEEFSAAIDNRLAQHHLAFLRFVGIKSAVIERASMTGKRAQITVRFVTEMISATTDANGAIVNGDQKQIRDIVDVWTFERDVTARDPNWRLTDTTDDS